MERTMKVRKNFYDLTEEDWKKIIARDEEAFANKRFLTMEELLKRLEEEYGV